MTTLELQHKPQLREALGNLGFPCELLVASVPSEKRIQVEQTLRNLNLRFYIFEDVEEYNEELQPSLFASLAELLTNEGIILRRFREKLKKGQLILAAHVADPEVASSVAELLYQTGISGAAYFATSRVSLLPPKS